MSSSVAAAFDPFFWFHHVNVDRLTAMYEVLYPNNRVTPAPARATFGRLVPGRDRSQDNVNTIRSGRWMALFIRARILFLVAQAFGDTITVTLKSPATPAFHVPKWQTM